MKITHPLFEMHRPIDDNLVGRYQVDPQSRHASYPSPPTSREGKSGMLIEVQFTRKICRKLIDIVSLGGYSRPGMADHGELTISDNSELGWGHAHSARLRLHY